MLNINNKPWDKLRFKDIQVLLSSDDDETVFFEYKSDKTLTKDIAEEVCAFANTYGGYLLLGVEDNKSITGCQQWKEQRIHTTLHDSITPTPIFDVRKFKTPQGIIFVIRVEEGPFPPYITSRGKILQRLSSGSIPIKDSYSLNRMFSKRKDELAKIEQKISIDEIKLSSSVPDNLCAYLDLGFAPSFHDVQETKKLFFNANLHEIATILKATLHHYSVSRFGNSLLITTGEISANRNGTKIAAPAGVNNFIEIMCDGSVRCRVCFALEVDSSCALVSQTVMIDSIFSTVYERIFGQKFYKNFISAEKYEKFIVLKQFSPTYDETHGPGAKAKLQRNVYQNRVFGGNIVVTSNRIPKTEYLTIDRQYFDRIGIKFNNDNLVAELFYLQHCNMGLFEDEESGFEQEDGQ